MTVVVGFLIGAAGGLLICRAQGITVLSVQTGSMTPTFRPGDAVFVQKLKGKSPPIGSIISYQSPRNSSIIVSHRLIAIDEVTGWLTTKGDNLSQPDPSFPPRLMVGQVKAVGLQLGLVLDALRRPVGLAICVYLPAIILAIAEVRNLSHSFKNSSYQLRPTVYAFVTTRR